MTPRWLVLLLSTLVLSVLAAPALSQWSPTGVPLCQSPCGGGMPQIVSDAQGGAFIVWRDARNRAVTDNDVYLQRVTASGTIAPGWPLGGLPVCAAPGDQAPYPLASDGQGGVLVVWEDFRNAGAGGTAQDLYAQRVLADGSLAPGWPLNGVPVSRAPDYQSLPKVAPDGAGGAFVAWMDERDYATQGSDVYAQHLTASGAVAAGWPADGLPVCTDPAGQGIGGLIPDGAGGAVVVWNDNRRGVPDIYAQHLLADGSIALGWVANGVPVVLERALRAVAPDEAGGFYAGGATLSPSWSDGVYYVQRFSFAGARSPGWPAGGVTVCAASDNRYALRMTADGLGGVLLTWYDYRPPDTGGEIYAARVLADGSLAPGWTVDGTRVSDATAPGFEYRPDIAPDGEGGAYLVWLWEYNGYPSLVQHLTRTATVAAGWPAYGVRVAPSGAQFDSRIASDGQRGAIVAWDERCCNRLGVYAQRFVLDGPVPAQVSLVSANAEPDRVRLAWYVTDAVAFHAAVERRRESSSWEVLGTVSADGTGRIEYQDRGVISGERYAYRLAYTEEGSERHTAETWVDVPRALTLALEGLRPNPAVGAVIVSFTLPTAAPATLELVDVSGRSLLRREIGALGAGRHLLRLEEGARVAPGMYWLRLRQSGRTLIARGVVVR